MNHKNNRKAQTFTWRPIIFKPHWKSERLNVNWLKIGKLIIGILHHNNNLVYFQQKNIRVEYYYTYIIEKSEKRRVSIFWWNSSQNSQIILMDLQFILCFQFSIYLIRVVLTVEEK